MKLKFKTQAYQTQAVQAVVDCFKGQPKASTSYRIDPGSDGQADFLVGSRNADLQIPNADLLNNIQTVQRSHNLQVSLELVQTKVANINLDIEMETGTGKTYCYIKTIFELNDKYGWNKFIIVVPSIAIREGVAKALAITSEHFTETYNKKIRSFIYNSKQLNRLESFSSDPGISVLIINTQAFASKGEDNRRIYEELDEFQSRRPIDVINANKPILILDEPQKLEGDQTLKSLEKFNALMVLRYSATHKTTHNQIYRLDALEAYNQKLVKKISVRGISIKGHAGTAGYLYLQSIETSSKKPPEALVEFECKLKEGIKRIIRKLTKGDDLLDFSNGLDQYRKGFVVNEINANDGTLSFTNGRELTEGVVEGDITESTLRRIQIREAIKAHFDKEQVLFAQNIKVLTLFFIDEVVKYRDYNVSDEKGEYARIFEEEYQLYYNEMLNLPETAYIKYLKNIAVEKTHSGYFSIDKKTNRLKDSDFKKRGENVGLSDDVDAYDLILKDKERLLSLNEPMRFIFSHSALREGWDNPNVFVICALKHNNNNVSRRQEIGRGLRLAVDQHGDRIDHPSIVHDINVLTVVANESYKDFVGALQKELRDSLSSRPTAATEDYFIGKTLKDPIANTDLKITPQLAKQIHRHLIQNKYIDDNDHITSTYFDARKDDTLVPLPENLQPYTDHAYQLIDSVVSGSSPEIADDRRSKKNPINSNFYKQEFKDLWERINHKAAYCVDFDETELVKKAQLALNTKLHVAPLQYTIQHGAQEDHVSSEDLRDGKAFKLSSTTTTTILAYSHSSVSYDLIGKLAEGTELTRRTIANILKAMSIQGFAQFKKNPENFIAESIRLINEQKATVIIEHLTYDPVQDRFDINIFTADISKVDSSKAVGKLQHHIYDYVLTDSKIERQFVEELDTSTEVAVYAKLPRGFLIPTPVGDYNPDWAIAFKKGAVKHVYFVAETKGSLSSMDLRKIEDIKIQCARKFFAKINQEFPHKDVKYHVVESVSTLLELLNKHSI